MTTPPSPQDEVSAVTELKKALLCLFIECPKPVAEDVGEKAEAVIALIQTKDAEIESLKDRIELRDDLLLRLEKKFLKAKEALKYCAIETGFLHPENNIQCAIAKNALAELGGYDDPQESAK